MGTYNQWLLDQGGRPDPVGELARLWRGYSHPKYASVTSVTKSLQEQAQVMQLPWVAEAIRQAVTEYRAEKAPSPHAVFENSQRLNTIAADIEVIKRGMSMVMVHMGISPLEAVQDGIAEVVELRPGDSGTEVHDSTEQQPAGDVIYLDAGQEALAGHPAAEVSWGWMAEHATADGTDEEL